MRKLLCFVSLVLVLFVELICGQYNWYGTQFSNDGHLSPWCYYRYQMKLPPLHASPYRTVTNTYEMPSFGRYPRYPVQNSQVFGTNVVPREGFANDVKARNMITGQTSPCQPGEVYVYRPTTLDFDSTPSICPSGFINRFLSCHCERGCRYKNFFIPHDKPVMVDTCGNKCSCSTTKPGEVDCEYGSC